MALHLDYCASFGLSKQEMEAHPETIGKTTCGFIFHYIVVLFVVPLLGGVALDDSH